MKTYLSSIFYLNKLLSFCCSVCFSDGCAWWCLTLLRDEIDLVFTIKHEPTDFMESLSYYRK